MKKSIQLQSITLENFKGVNKKTIEFSQSQTNIFGANATGKTTIFDAFVWCLFGKDSTDRKDFEIKQLDSVGKTTDQRDVKVKVVLLVDSEQINIERVLHENWVKRRGSETTEFAGNVTNFYWNAVPMQQKEFQARVNEVLEESIFKLITNPMAFNGLNWKDRRNILLTMAPVAYDDIAAGNEAFQNLLIEAANHRDLAEYSKMIAASIKKSKDDLKEIPVRIDELLSSKPELKDFDGLRKELDSAQNQFDTIDKSIQDKNAAVDGLINEQTSIKNKAAALDFEINQIVTNTRAEVEASLRPDTGALDKFERIKSNITANISDLNIKLSRQQKEVNHAADSVSKKEKELNELREKFTTVNAEEFVFDDQDTCCPTCKRAFEASDVSAKRETLQASFNQNKVARLEQINADGKKLKSEFEEAHKNLETASAALNETKEAINLAEKELTTVKEEIDQLIESQSQSAPTQNDIDSFVEQKLYTDKNYNLKVAELKSVKDSIKDVQPLDNSELLEQRNAAQQRIDQIKNELSVEAQIQSVDARVKELKEKQAILNQEVANVEKKQFLIDSFNKAYIESVEQNIASRFKLVKFKMFNELINGGTEECCEATIDGVPFSDANTASKINAGIDIINTLCDFYGITAPIFIDNRESVVNLIESESQIINLIVSEADKSLRVA